ncbi:hypothetical protein BDP27DRAFT_1371028 [Rhodocollybia butyracea]|uniref:Uncharacterized protein n=1 Tax=Rhodocollybia butyracea TaxID=206335 RepID=A0A9P5PD44_9AGAR|nr:hypothetical protein BDP27DRAFT_1371028 [Rhodocollybia butyracea]
MAKGKSGNTKKSTKEGTSVRKHGNPGKLRGAPSGLKTLESYLQQYVKATPRNKKAFWDVFWPDWLEIRKRNRRHSNEIVPEEDDQDMLDARQATVIFNKPDYCASKNPFAKWLSQLDTAKGAPRKYARRFGKPNDEDMYDGDDTEGEEDAEKQEDGSDDESLPLRRITIAKQFFEAESAENRALMEEEAEADYRVRKERYEKALSREGLLSAKNFYYPALLNEIGAMIVIKVTLTTAAIESTPDVEDNLYSLK